MRFQRSLCGVQQGELPNKPPTKSPISGKSLHVEPRGGTLPFTARRYLYIAHRYHDLSRLSSSSPAVVGGCAEPVGNRACKYYRLVDPGSIEGSHRPVVYRGGNNEKHRERLSRTLQSQVSTDRLNSQLTIFSFCFFSLNLYAGYVVALCVVACAVSCRL